MFVGFVSSHLKKPFEGTKSQLTIVSSITTILFKVLLLPKPEMGIRIYSGDHSCTLKKHSVAFIRICFQKLNILSINSALWPENRKCRPDMAVSKLWVGLFHKRYIAKSGFSQTTDKVSRSSLCHYKHHSSLIMQFFKIAKISLYNHKNSNIILFIKRHKNIG